MAIYGYVRVSTAQQASDGDSLEAQVRQIRSYAVLRGFDLSLNQLVTESGVSGNIEFQLRPEGGSLLRMLKRGDILIFSKLDRAFRNTRNALNTLHDLKERGVSVHFIDLGGDVTNDGVGSVIFTILSAFATFERERLATRIREVKQIQKADGRFLGGVPRFGYRVADGRLERDPTHQRILREMRTMRRRGMSYRRLARWVGEKYSVTMSHSTVASLFRPFKTTGHGSERATE